MNPSTKTPSTARRGIDGSIYALLFYITIRKVVQIVPLGTREI
jgi:hypothetical protein